MRGLIRPAVVSEIARAQRPEVFGRQVSEGLIEKVGACLCTDLTEEQEECMTFLCAPGVCHYSSTSADSGFGCGWRNLQMQISHLLNTRQCMRDILFNGAGYVPNIASLQAWLECAWLQGFDCEGAEQLGHTVQGTRTWIGTTEVAALLHQFGVITKIVDFGVNPSLGRSGDLLLRWVWKFYSSHKEKDVLSPAVVVTSAPPLYFQYQGHSRTIVGIQRRKKEQDSFVLLVLDPQMPSEAVARALERGDVDTVWQGYFKLEGDTLRNEAQWQLLYVPVQNEIVPLHTHVWESLKHIVASEHY